ncbi:MAG: GGDEF domain-containing protein [Chitinispirillaceae bacterium]|nr:GGDEF domain-containing protein [Chitinispirillaceae bacterium]
MEYFAGYLKNFLSTGLMASGAFVLIAALLAADRIIRQLPKGKVRRNWSFLGVLIGVLIIAYLSYAVVSWMSGFMDYQSIGLYAVPLSYFLCACIVYLVISFVLNSDVYFSHSPAGEFEDIIDPMMGIYNRRYLDSRLYQEIRRAQRYNLPMSVMLVSIDNISQLNDTCGKGVRDQLLSSFAKMVLHSARITDITARYGEAEIMVVATNTPVSSVSVFADRARKIIADTLQIPQDPSSTSSLGKNSAEIKLSIGVSGLGADTDTRESLLNSVENALSQARSLGSNMVIVNKPDTLSN